MKDKIEPGCNAIFIGLKIDVELNGCEVLVVDYDYNWSDLECEDHWFVDCSAIGRSGPVRARNLMRIDGLSENKTKQLEAVL